MILQIWQSPAFLTEQQLTAVTLLLYCSRCATVESNRLSGGDDTVNVCTFHNIGHRKVNISGNLEYSRNAAAFSLAEIFAATLHTPHLLPRSSFKTLLIRCQRGSLASKSSSWSERSRSCRIHRWNKYNLLSRLPNFTVIRPPTGWWPLKQLLELLQHFQQPGFCSVPLSPCYRTVSMDRPMWGRAAAFPSVWESSSHLPQKDCPLPSRVPPLSVPAGVTQQTSAPSRLSFSCFSTETHRNALLFSNKVMAVCFS